jgi:CheY-like chemotaxis protein/glycine cleavage system H lipoate-binding protein
MVPLIVLLTVIIFIVVDLVLRLSLRKLEERRLQRKRQEALEESLRLEFADEAASLKRARVDEPKARILAVDDEPIVLDSFRKILVLAGYSVDTVETGPEALALVRRNDYEFVFADLKMPGMDGLDVVKAVRHLRPDIDVAIITGYATVESAVSAMKFGAMDYVQKPFTEDELVEFADQLLIRREDRIARQTPPEIHLVTRSEREAESPHTINVPGGVYVAPEHTWVSVEMTGEGRIGLDDFFHKTVGAVDDVELPQKGAQLRRGEILFRVKHGEHDIAFPSPLSGRVSRVNHELTYNLDLFRQRPYEAGWICCVAPGDLTEDLRRLRIGADAVGWYQDEVDSFRRTLSELVEKRPTAESGEPTADEVDAVDEAWQAFADSCVTAEREVVEATS